jgi:uncharacterized metal-binding protein/predicted Fe-Mo cluster-binding NifX family protein
LIQQVTIQYHFEDIIRRNSGNLVSSFTEKPYYGIPFAIRCLRESMMRYGIPLLGNRVAPRCTCADSVLLVVLKRNRVSTEENVVLSSHSLVNLVELISDYRVDTLVCCGISRESREFLSAKNVNIIDNVSCTADEIIEALKEGSLYPGFGFIAKPESESMHHDTGGALPMPGKGIGGESAATAEISGEDLEVDCISCREKVCLTGKECALLSRNSPRTLPESKEVERILEAGLDIACEEERKLCRLSEVIYFCLEMKYKRIGIAYCSELQEPAEILTQVMRRFFDVFPICCKIGGLSVSDPFSLKNPDSSPGERREFIACNPRGQAEVLNRLKTDINIIVGLCVGSDSVFTEASEAGVTTLFVKDKSLANNPIGALYSDYYLNEASTAEAS